MSRREIAQLAKKARRQGWTIVRQRKHMVFISPTGEKIFTSSTPSDPRAWKNLRAMLRRTGLFYD